MKNEIGKLEEQIESTQQKMNSRCKKLLKQRPLDHAVLYLVQHPELISAEPIATERLLLCCWESQNIKNLGIVLDMLVDSGMVVTLDELGEIVLSFIKQGLHCNEKVHKYVLYLLFAKVYKLPVNIWKEYLTQVLVTTQKEFNNTLSGFESVQKDVDSLFNHLVEIYKNTCSDTVHDPEGLTQHFKEILEATFYQIEGYMNECLSQTEKKKKREFVFRPLILTLLNNKISLNSLLRNNEQYNKLVVEELVTWGCESPDFFKALFLKIDFKNGKFPWSTFKGIKEEFKNLEKDSLYFYVTKYFLDNHADDDEVSNYVFTNKEYKDLIKYFLDHCEEFKEDSGFKINEKNEPEFEGFVIIE